MNLDPIEGALFVVVLVGAMLAYTGMPIILPASVLARKHRELTNPRMFGALSMVLCILARLLVYRVLAAFPRALGDDGMWPHVVVEGTIMALVILGVGRVYAVSAPTSAPVRPSPAAGDLTHESGERRPAQRRPTNQ